ncbi:hypothetical protein AVEN_103263-1 [Araneus ventricosus]|uniref:Uncharacterized protein n=1 Tax=Araneus ventricosus TaxID=182803 RepID=A0A4Y2KP47_ARAVE|nr:hypothetical protein AVEN_103263-1 [Araneus ventricosus]
MPANSGKQWISKCAGQLPGELDFLKRCSHGQWFVVRCLKYVLPPVVGTLVARGQLEGGLNYSEMSVSAGTSKINIRIECTFAASVIFSGYYLVMTNLTRQVCSEIPAK